MDDDDVELLAVDEELLEDDESVELLVPEPSLEDVLAEESPPEDGTDPLRESVR